MFGDVLTEKRDFCIDIFYAQLCFLILWNLVAWLHQTEATILNVNKSASAVHLWHQTHP